MSSDLHPEASADGLEFFTKNFQPRVCDENGNADIINCTDCICCVNCRDCVSCEDCCDCVACKKCQTSKNCSDGFYCIDSQYCEKCKGVVSCIDCKECLRNGYCRGCVRCTDCECCLDLTDKENMICNMPFEEWKELSKRERKRVAKELNMDYESVKFCSKKRDLD